MQRNLTLQKPFKGLLPFLFILILGSIAFANPNWYTWGNVGADFAGTQADNILFGSNYPQGNLNFTKNSLGIGTNTTPIVADLNNQGENNVYLFDGNILYQISNEGDIINSIVMTTGNFCGGAVVMNQGNDLDLELFAITDDGSDYYINMFSQGESTGITTLENSAIIANTLTITEIDCNLHGLFGQDNIYSIIIDATNPGFENLVMSIDISTLAFDVPLTVTAPRTEPFIGINDRNTPIGYSNIADWDKDGNTEMSWAVSDGGLTDDLYIIEYEIETETYRSFMAESNTNGDVMVAFANIGAPATVLELIVTNMEIDPNEGGQTKVYDTSLNTQITMETCSNQMTFPSVADINKDGNNEICTMCYPGAGTPRLICYDSIGTQTINYNLSESFWQDNDYMALGEYNDSNNYLEVITGSGIFSLDNNGNTSLDYDLDISVGLSGMYLPVSIENQAEFIKDLMYADSTNTIFYIASGTPTVCGNNVCESGETIFTCFEDCGAGEDTSTNLTQGNFGNGQKCSTSDDCYGNLTCTNNVCVGLSGGVACTFDFECRSGECNEFGFCDRLPVTDEIDQQLTLFGFGNTAGKLLIALFIVSIFTIGGLTTGGSVGVGGAIFGGILGLIISSFIVILVFGWLGVWVIFTAVFIIIAMTALILFFGGGG